MSEHAGERTEAPTPRRLEEAQKRGQFARSPEVQTLGVVAGALLGLLFAGTAMWDLFHSTLAVVLSRLHDTPLSPAAIPRQVLAGLQMVGGSVWPVFGGALLGGLLAGAIQNRFTTCPEALGFKFERLDPAKGFQRIFSMRSAVPAGVALFKLLFIGLLAWSTIREVFGDPIFTQAVGIDRIAVFLTQSSWKILTRVLLLLGIVAAADYAYQCWRTYEDLKMTRQEVKDEAKNSEGNPQIKIARRRLMNRSIRKMLALVPQADVVITNPTHLAVALKYDRHRMNAPQILAKGARLNAQRIREVAAAHGIPLVENKPLARLMYKYGKPGGEIPAQLYAAVAEVLAWVYRNHRYRYYAAANRAETAQ